MNAYLTYAAAVGAGLYGIEHKIEPPAEFKGNGYLATGCDRMPRALWEAIGELERSEAAVEIFGQDVVDHCPAGERVQHLGNARPHAGALAGGQDDGGRSGHATGRSRGRIRVTDGRRRLNRASTCAH